MNNAKAKDIDLSVDMNDAFVAGWDAECDKSFLIGAHKHGRLNNFIFSLVILLP